MGDNRLSCKKVFHRSARVRVPPWALTKPLIPQRLFPLLILHVPHMYHCGVDPVPGHLGRGGKGRSREGLEQRRSHSALLERTSASTRPTASSTSATLSSMNPVRICER